MHVDHFTSLLPPRTIQGPFMSVVLPLKHWQRNMADYSLSYPGENKMALRVDQITLSLYTANWSLDLCYTAWCHPVDWVPMQHRVWGKPKYFKLTFSYVYPSSVLLSMKFISAQNAYFLHQSRRNVWRKHAIANVMFSKYRSVGGFISCLWSAADTVTLQWKCWCKHHKKHPLHRT